MADAFKEFEARRVAHFATLRDVVSGRVKLEGLTDAELDEIRDSHGWYEGRTEEERQLKVEAWEIFREELARRKANRPPSDLEVHKGAVRTVGSIDAIIEGIEWLDSAGAMWLEEAARRAELAPEITPEELSSYDDAKLSRMESQTDRDINVTDAYAGTMARRVSILKSLGSTRLNAIADALTRLQKQSESRSATLRANLAAIRAEIIERSERHAAEAEAKADMSAVVLELKRRIEQLEGRA